MVSGVKRKEILVVTIRFVDLRAVRSRITTSGSFPTLLDTSWPSIEINLAASVFFCVKIRGIKWDEH